MLTSEIAEHIVRETMVRLRRNVNMMDEHGTIIASGRRERIGQRHAGALEAIRRGEMVVIQPRDVGVGAGELPGVNMPIVFQGQTVGAIGITGSPDEIAEFAELVRMATELMIQQQFLVSLKERQERLRGAFAEELAKDAPDPARLRGHLELLRVEPIAPMRICLARWAGGGVDPLPFLRSLEHIWGSSAVVALAPDGRGLVIAAFGCDEAVWESRFGRMRRTASSMRIAARYGVSAEGSSVEELDLLMREAEFALSLAGAEEAVTADEGLIAQQLVSVTPPRRKARLATRTASALTASLRATLQAYFDCNCNAQAAADALFVHKNTVTYRLRKVKEATGLDPHRFADAAVLQVGLWVGSDKEGNS